MEYKKIKDTELYHHGVKGMKWGVIRENVEKASTSIGEIGKAAKSIDDTLDKGRKGKSTHPDYSHLSDEQLRKEVNRMNLENQYAQLKGQSKYKASGQEKAHEILQSIGILAAVTTALTPFILAGIKHVGPENIGGWII